MFVYLNSNRLHNVHIFHYSIRPYILNNHFNLLQCSLKSAKQRGLKLNSNFATVWRDRGGRMVVEFTTTYLIRSQCLSPLILWVRIPLDTTLCDKVCQWLVTGWWFSRRNNIRWVDNSGYPAPNKAASVYYNVQRSKRKCANHR